MYFHQLNGLRYGKTSCVEELCFHSSKTVPYWIVPIFRRLAFFGNPLKSDTWVKSHVVKITKLQPATPQRIRWSYLLQLSLHTS